MKGVAPSQPSVAQIWRRRADPGDGWVRGPEGLITDAGRGLCNMKQHESRARGASQRCARSYSAVQVQCCFTSTQTVRTILDGEEGAIIYQVQCCFTSTQTIRTIRDGEKTVRRWEKRRLYIKFNVANMLLASEDIKQKELYVLQSSGAVRKLR